MCQNKNLTIHQLSKFMLGKCVTAFCRNFKAKRRTVCLRCEKKIYAKNNPVRYIFSVWKNNSRRRGKENTVTWQQFQDFCAETSYDQKKGTKSLSLQIDRIDNSRGYHADNIQAITLQRNVQKYHEEIIPF